MNVKVMAALRVMTPFAAGAVGGLIATISPETFAAFCGAGL